MLVKTVSIVEALFESVPQLCLQVRAGFVGEELNDWVFILTVSVSALCIVKAIVTFARHHEEIRKTLFLDLQRERGFRSSSLGANQRQLPLGAGSDVAAPEQVKANPDELEPRTGPGERRIVPMPGVMRVYDPRPSSYRVGMIKDPPRPRRGAPKRCRSG